MTVDRTPLLEALGVDLPDELLTMALTHRSYSFENGGLPTNERLEFLGDAVLGLLVADILIRRHPDSPEGELAKLRNSIVMADGVEALLGAVYMQHGFDASRDVVLRLFGDLLDTAPSLGAALEWKSSLQELTVARGLGVPKYVVSFDGPDHDRVFSAVVLVDGEEYGAGVGSTKKEAEIKAAAQAWTSLDAQSASDGGIPVPSPDA
ncbi:MAG: ribonuclease [Mycobacterium sp.]|nr:ribonuclease [Mycobacterium sp.]